MTSWWRSSPAPEEKHSPRRKNRFKDKVAETTPYVDSNESETSPYMISRSVFRRPSRGSSGGKLRVPLQQEETSYFNGITMKSPRRMPDDTSFIGKKVPEQFKSNASILPRMRSGKNLSQIPSSLSINVPVPRCTSSRNKPLKSPDQNQALASRGDRIDGE